MAQKQQTKIEQSLSTNTVVDKCMMAIAAAVFTMLAYNTVLAHVRAVQPINYVLAGLFTALLLYLVLSPLFRK